MEGKVIDIQLKGIVRNTPGAVSPDGELEEAVNLRYKDGAFRPIPDRVAYATVTGYNPVHVHSNAGYKHFLGVASGQLWYIGDDKGNGFEPKSPVVAICSISGTPSFTQIGNVVNILDSTGLKYAIWYDSAYVSINSDFDGSQTDTSVGVVGKVDLRVGGIVPAWVPRPPYYLLAPDYPLAERRLYRTDDTFAENGETLDKAIIALFTKARSIEEKEGRMMDFHLACTAVELYDGTYILQSNPVLLGQTYDSQARYRNYVVTNDGVNVGTAGDISLSYDYETNKAFIRLGASTESVPTGDEYIKDDCYEYLTRAEIWPTAAGMTRGSEIKGGDTPPFFAHCEKNQPAWVAALASKFQIRVNQNIPNELRPLVKSLSVFLTPGVMPYDLEKTVDKLGVAWAAGYWEACAYPKFKTDATIRTELLALPNFYKVHEIPFDSLQAGTWVDIDLKDKLGDAMASLEVMPVDNFSHHKTLPAMQFVYNSKLHAANYKTLLSRGFPIANFYPESAVGQFNPQTWTAYTPTNEYIWWIKVDIKTSNGISSVVRYFHKLAGVAGATGSDLAAMLSYPDSRAIKMTIYQQFLGYHASEYKLGEFPLKAHDSQNFAYYLSSDLKPIPFCTTTPAQPAGTNGYTPPTEVQREQSFSNSMKVSEVNNPFTFPALTTYQIGNGDIRALASNAIALSTGQFGEYPLYVFCSDGIYAMYVGGGAITYSASKPVARDVCIGSNAKPVDGGVVFVTDRGAMMISGSQVTELSLPLRGEALAFTDNTSNDYLELLTAAVDNAALVQLKTSASIETFLSFLAGAKVGYNYLEREIWFTRSDKTYSYIYKQGVWFKVKDTAVMFVDDYPTQYLLRDGVLYNIGKEATTSTQTMFLTRPLKMGTQGFKQAMRVVLRGLVNTATSKYAGVYIFGSYDCIKWAYLGGTESTGNLRDLGATVERVDCKYFRIGFVGNLKPDSNIDYVEISVKGKLGEKLR